MLNLKEKEIINILKRGGVGIMPTDTLYGLVCSAFSRKAIKRIYKIKKRNKKKKLIVLISSIKDLENFGVKINKNQAKILKKFWPGKVSIIIGSTAFRLPKNKKLIEIIKKTGPLVAPSANPEGLAPAKNIIEAKEYFGNSVDFYLDKGNLKSQPSKLIKIDKNGEIKILRDIIKR